MLTLCSCVCFHKPMFNLVNLSASTPCTIKANLSHGTTDEVTNEWDINKQEHCSDCTIIRFYFSLQMFALQHSSLGKGHRGDFDVFGYIDLHFIWGKMKILKTPKDRQINNVILSSWSWLCWCSVHRHCWTEVSEP